jgi:cell growth-regulating nucleolar protein
MVHFPGTEYRSHTSCMTEDQKYQGALYKDKKNNKNKNKPEPQAAPPAEERATSMPPHAYVEDAGDEREYGTWDDYQGQTEDEKSPAEQLPEAPTPPSAHHDEVNVFDFLDASGQTPNASKLNLPRNDAEILAHENNSLVRYEYTEEEEYLEGPVVMQDDDEPLVQYGSGPVATGKFVTPASKSERRRSKESELKKDKKRKRLHLDIPGDHPMEDAPPVLHHSGLTGGLTGLMKSALPPSPDYSGGDGAEPLPTSPTKKTKSKHSRSGTITNSLFGMLASTAKPKTKKKSSKKHSSRHREEKEKQPKLIEYRPSSKDSKNGSGEGQMIVYKPRADVFLGFVNKGPDSERGCSMNKTLKRFHRQRQASGSTLAKSKEEKELFKSLRLRRNERGEIVVFSDSLDLDALL